MRYGQYKVNYQCKWRLKSDLIALMFSVESEMLWLSRDTTICKLLEPGDFIQGDGLHAKTTCLW